jgi:hypothetical protein
MRYKIPSSVWSATQELGCGIAVRLRKPGGMRIFQHFSGGLFLENLFDAARKRC